MSTKTGISVTFTPLGFNPHTEQVCFVATVKGKNGQENFNYSGGYLAFVPSTKIVPQSTGPAIRRPFDAWKYLETQGQRERGFHGPILSVVRAIRAGKVKASKNTDNPDVMWVFRTLASLAKPQAEGLLASLHLDAQADGMSFVEWCAEFGYDNDSIKAENIYRACVETARNLQRVLSREQLAELEEIAANE